MSEKLTDRRVFLKQVALVGAGVMASPTFALEPRITPKIKNIYPFYGTHQQGIATPAQKNIYFMVLDLHSTDLNKIKEMFKIWTDYSAKLTQGLNVKSYPDNAYIPPTDTGEADSLNPYNLTLTFGVSASFFDKLGIAQFKPKQLKDLPHFPRD